MRLLPGVRSLGGILSLLCGLLLFPALLGCGSGYATISTSVAPLASEDLQGPCTFDLVLAPLVDVQRGVLVLYDRGDTDSLYRDDTLRATAKELGFAIVWAHECDAKTFGDLQADAAKGPARALFAALADFAHNTAHPELENAKVVLYGFSAAGVLTATMLNEHPDRLLGVIEYAAGSAYVDLDDVPVSSAAAAIPALLLANAGDTRAGTSRSYRYFGRGRASGAPWAYAVQNGTGHCCTLSTREVILPWIRAISGSPSSAGGRAASSSGQYSQFVCTPDGIEDAQGEIDCSFSSAGLMSSDAVAGKGEIGWLPDLATGDAWLTWVTQKNH